MGISRRLKPQTGYGSIAHRLLLRLSCGIAGELIGLHLPHALQFLYLGRETGRQIARLRAVRRDAFSSCHRSPLAAAGAARAENVRAV